MRKMFRGRRAAQSTSVSVWLPLVTSGATRWLQLLSPHLSPSSPCVSGGLRPSAPWRQQATLSGEALPAAAVSPDGKGNEMEVIKTQISEDQIQFSKLQAEFSRLKTIASDLKTETSSTSGGIVDCSAAIKQLELSKSMGQAGNEEKLKEEHKLKELTQELKELEQKSEKLKQKLNGVHMKQHGLHLQLAAYACSTWTLETFLSDGLQCLKAVDLSDCPAWRAFCNVMPPGLRSFLTTARHPLDGKQCWPWDFVTTNDDYRLWMANVAGSLIRKNTLDAFQRCVASHMRQLLADNPNSAEAEHQAVEMTLSSALQRLRQEDFHIALTAAIDGMIFRDLRHARFGLNALLAETDAAQLVTHKIHVGDLTFRVICSSDIHVSRARPQGTNAVYVDRVLQERIASTRRPVIVSGASGSGKTMLSLMSAGADGLVMYTVAHDYNHCEGLAEKPGRCDQAVAKAIASRVSKYAAGRPISTRFPGKFVLVIDEAGSTPVLVRSLCRIHHDVCIKLAKLLKLDPNRISILVCGTGVERPDGAPGLVASSYQLINMSEAKNELSFFDEYTVKCIETTHQLPRLAAILRTPLLSGGDAVDAEIKDLQRHAVVQKCRRLLRNRRMAGLFLTELQALITLFHHDKVDTLFPWPTQMATIMQKVFVGYRGMNALQEFSTKQIKWLFAEALAMCLGGPYQYKALGTEAWRREVLFSTTGLLQDNRVMAAQGKSLAGAQAVSGAEAPEMQAATKEDTEGAAVEKAEMLRYFGLDCSDYRTAIEQHGMRCYSMTPAMIEGGLCGFTHIIWGTQGDATSFEQSLANIALLWLHAQVSRIPIDLTLPANLAELLGGTKGAADVTCAFKFLELLNWSGTREHSEVQHVARIECLDPVRSVSEAWIAAHHHHDQSSNVKPGDVIRTVIINCPHAPFGDVIVIVGRKGGAEPLRCLIIQRHDNRRAGVSEAAAAEEHTVPSTGGSNTNKAVKRQQKAKSSRPSSPAVEVKTLALICGNAVENSTHDRGDCCETIALTDSALRMALRPVELCVSPFDRRSDVAPRALHAAVSSFCLRTM